MTIIGTRPEIVRLSRVIPLLDERCEHTLIHTGQNFDPKLSDIFFDELKLRKPDKQYEMGALPFGEAIGKIMSNVEDAIFRYHPDRVLILGDTNTGLSSIVVRRAGIPLYHMEAGNRCFDFKVPEEVNRRVVDHMTTVHMPYNEHSRRNLLREGIHPKDIFVTGNPIGQVINTYMSDVGNSRKAYELTPPGENSFFLVTMHRQENVTVEHRLRTFFESFKAVYEEFQVPMIFSVHPRTRDNLKKFNINEDDCPGFIFIEPLGLIDFLSLESKAHCVLTDSGTCQEECCILGTPCVTLRNTTERPETIDAGANILAGCDRDSILEAIRSSVLLTQHWTQPDEYRVLNVAETVAKIVTGHRASTLD